MKSISYLFEVLFYFMLMAILYFIVVDQYVIYEKDIDGISYNLSLLDSLSDYEGKVIVIGGSDAYIGINAEALEGLLNRPVINFSRNVNIPYDQYIYAIKKYLKKGDLVIAVMGWPYLLSEQKLTDNYIDALLNDQVTYNYLYKSLPLYNRIRLVFTQIPYQKVLRVVFSRPDDVHKIRYQINSTKSTIKGLDMLDSRGGFSSETLAIDFNNKINSLTCDQFFISRFTELPLINVYPSNATIRNLELLKSLENKGVNVIFSWGIAVDKDGDSDKCYRSDDSNNLNIFASRVREALNEKNIPVIGEYHDYLSTEECFLNSHAHIKRSCATIFTSWLYKNGLVQHTNQNNQVDSAKITKDVLERIRASSKKYVQDHISLNNSVMDGKIFSVNEFDKHIYFGEGWSTVEEWGLWTEGNISKLMIKNNSSASSVLYLNGMYFNGDEETEVIINKVKIGNFILKNKSINLPAQTRKSEMLTIELRHKFAVSPKSLNSQSNDIRKIKFGLKEVGLN